MAWGDFFRFLGGTMQSLGEGITEKRYRDEMLDMERRKVKVQEDVAKAEILRENADTEFKKFQTDLAKATAPETIALTMANAFKATIDAKLHEKATMANILNVEESTATSKQARDPAYMRSILQMKQDIITPLAVAQRAFDAVQQFQSLAHDTQMTIFKMATQNLALSNPEDVGQFISRFMQAPELQPVSYQPQMAEVARMLGVKGMEGLSVPQMPKSMPVTEDLPPEEYEQWVDTMSRWPQDAIDTTITQWQKKGMSSEQLSRLQRDVRLKRIERTGLVPQGVHQFGKTPFTFFP